MKLALSLLILVSGLISTVVQAGIPRASVTSVVAKAYGLYISDDPLCQTNLIPTVPLSTTPTNIEMTADQEIGEGPAVIPRCVVMLLKNDVNMIYAPGTYTTTSTGGADSVCNAGGSISSLKICHSGTTIVWPAQIQADMNALGLSMTTTCTGSGDVNAIVPIFLSTNSACTGDTTVDPSACRSGGANSTFNTFKAPTAVNDGTRGVKLVAPTGVPSQVKFVMDFDKAIGNENGACASLSPPKFRFEEY